MTHSTYINSQMGSFSLHCSNSKVRMVKKAGRKRFENALIKSFETSSNMTQLYHYLTIPFWPAYSIPDPEVGHKGILSSCSHVMWGFVQKLWMRAFSQHLAGIFYNPNLAIRTMCLTCLAASRANKTERKTIFRIGQFE